MSSEVWAVIGFIYFFGGVVWIFSWLVAGKPVALWLTPFWPLFYLRFVFKAFMEGF